MMRECLIRIVPIWVNLTCPAHYIDIIWSKYEFVGFEQVSRGKTEADSERETEPKVGRVEDEDVVAEYGSVEPTGRNQVVNCLKVR